jgi:integrase
MTDRKLLEVALCALLNYPLTEGQAIQALRARLAQPEKEWVGLTDEEIHNIEQECDQKFEDYFEFANAIEAKLKEKNAT